MKAKIIMITGILLFLYACKEDEKGQYAIHSGAPGQVVSARVVENLPGGAIIVYEIPREEDALYVRACYTLDDGTLMELKSSVYTNKITIVGIGRAREIPVVLTVVDRSQNESEPLTVMIYPLDSPIFDIAKSMSIKEDFGGIALRWDNPTKESVVIDVLSPDNNNDMRQVERFYSQMEAGKVNVRGQQAIETFFSVTIRDRWGNSTDPISGNFTPLFEEQLDKSKFRRFTVVGLPYTLQASGYDIENVWNDVWWQGGDRNSSASGRGVAVMDPYLVFDMGQVARLSRFKIYNRPEEGRLYGLAHPRRFEFWGSTSPDVTADFDSWQFLGYWESFKPSGLPEGQTSDEDLAYAAVEGEDYEMENCPPVRYLRFQVLETWGHTEGRIQLEEMTFWGEVQQ